MKKWLGPVIFGVVVAVGWAEETLSRRLTTEEYERAGLAKLSAAELSQLDGLFKKYGAAGISAPRPAAKPAPVTPSAPPPAPVRRTVVAEAPAPRAAPPPAPARREVAAEAPAPQVAPAAPMEPALPPAATEPKEKGDGFLAKARKALTPSGPKKEESGYETAIDGEFTGWNTATVWTMKDGSVWRVDNRPQPFYAKPVTNPRVRIKEAMLGGYWLEFVDLKLSVRVRLVK